MKTAPPPLLPIFRSAGQARLLSVLFLSPERSFSLSDLARRADLDAGNVHREVSRLESAGIVTTARVGTARMVRADEDSPVHEELSRLVLKTLGPPVVLARELAVIKGIEAAFVFGSWAQRMRGEAGPSPGDIDLLVVGDPDRRAVSAACRRAEASLGREVQPTIVSSADWSSPRTGFLQGLKAGALIRIDLGDSDGHR